LFQTIPNCAVTSEQTLQEIFLLHADFRLAFGVRLCYHTRIHEGRCSVCCRNFRPCRPVTEACRRRYSWGNCLSAHVGTLSGWFLPLAQERLIAAERISRKGKHRCPHFTNAQPAAHTTICFSERPERRICSCGSEPTRRRPRPH
jgi:hypothetical protein